MEQTEEELAARQAELKKELKEVEGALELVKREAKQKLEEELYMSLFTCGAGSTVATESGIYVRGIQYDRWLCYYTGRGVPQYHSSATTRFVHKELLIAIAASESDTGAKDRWETILYKDGNIVAQHG